MRGVAVCMVLILLAGCLNAPGAPTPVKNDAHGKPPTGDAPADTGLVGRNSAFAGRLLRELVTENPGKDVVLSPVSVSVALAMALDGARGPTRDAMLQTLGFAAKDDVNSGFRALLTNLTQEQPNVTLSIADSMWLEQRFSTQVEPSFSRDVTDDYFADLYVRDFRAPATVADINKWASDKTEGKVPKVIDVIDQKEVLFLLNAVYFKGTWLQRFDPQCTHQATFTGDDGTRSNATMMCGMNDFAVTYATRDGFAVARLPYEGNRLAMYVLLPDKGTTIDSVISRWDAATLDGVKTSNVHVELPRFTLASQLDLQPSLTALGMGLAFTDRANFSGIAPNLFISRVQQDAMMDVDENGTVAAAVTTVGVGVTSAPPPPYRFTVDHAFLVVLRDDASGSVLFLGKVADPRV